VDVLADELVILLMVPVEEEVLELLEELPLLPPLLPRPPLDNTWSLSRNSRKTILSQLCTFIFDFCKSNFFY
jgi:hypothetical protein